MFINFKLNSKFYIFLLIILFCILCAYSIYQIYLFASNNSKDVINMNTNNFTNILKEVHNFPENYYGKKIKSEGFIYIPDNFNSNEFVIARNMIVCCQTDSIIVGFLCTSNDISSFKPNSWVKIEGIICNDELHKIPIINVTSIKETRIPNNITVTPPTI